MRREEPCGRERNLRLDLLMRGTLPTYLLLLTLLSCGARNGGSAREVQFGRSRESM